MSSTASSSATDSVTPVKPAGKSSTTAVAAGVSIGLVILIALGIAAYFYGYRRRRILKKQTKGDDHRRETVMGLGHAASRVTPFYPFTGDGPRFDHTPGAGMRVANRRADGGWEFSDPFGYQPPITPFTQTAPSSCASPTGSEFTLVSTTVKKEKKMPGELTTRGFVEPESDVLAPAPPAYTRDPTSPPITPVYPIFNGGV
ncbi:hypothetical protein BXZ70DRAFT_955008 [Cristinia sonorae]|uniref:Uncharacterized protein n=1 Tax=Cristinia sonorae TaxID=1940300 RepID=A0A8K0XLC1_9AGAR|nr:hypothetical protein BXZ70DRAFT_955008 [Cristinia sonorae]